MGASVRKSRTFPWNVAEALMPVEWVLIFFGILTIILYQHFHLPMPGQPGSESSLGPGLFYLKQLLTSLDLYALVWIVQIVGHALIALRRYHWSPKKVPWQEIGNQFSHRLDLKEIFQDLRLFHSILVMFVLFALLKNIVPHVNGRLYDEVFASSEKWMCGGAYCSAWLYSWFGQSSVEFIGSTYRWYFPYMSIVLFIFIAQNNRRLAHEYCCTFVLLFLIGALWIYVLPTWGPIYWEPTSFSYLIGSSIGELQQELWRMKLHLDENPTSREAVFLISGFPSLHVAVVLLGSWYLFGISRWLGIVSALFLVLIINSTVFLGWHYVADDVGSVLLFFYCRELVRRFSWKWRRDMDPA